MSALERKAHVPAPNPHQVLGPCIGGRGIPRGPPSNSHGDWPFQRPPEQVPEVPVRSREHLPQLEKIQEVLPSRRDEAHFRGGVSRLINLASGTSKGSFTPLLQLKKFPDIPDSTREEARESRPHTEEPRLGLLD